MMCNRKQVVFLLLGLALLLLPTITPVTWAAPGQSPARQTVPTRTPTDEPTLQPPTHTPQPSPTSTPTQKPKKKKKRPAEPTATAIPVPTAVEAAHQLPESGGAFPTSWLIAGASLLLGTGLLAGALRLQKPR